MRDHVRGGSLAGGIFIFYFTLVSHFYAFLSNNLIRSCYNALV